MCVVIPEVGSNVVQTLCHCTRVHFSFYFYSLFKFAAVPWPWMHHNYWSLAHSESVDEGISQSGNTTAMLLGKPATGGTVWHTAATWLVCKCRPRRFQLLNWDTLARPWQTHRYSKETPRQYGCCGKWIMHKCRGEVENTDGGKKKNICRVGGGCRRALAESCAGVCLLF